jgi:pentatricopeptide repeat protein
MHKNTQVLEAATPAPFAVQPQEGLRAYSTMLAEGFTANATTYNALIQAYSRLNKLDRVLDVRSRTTPALLVVSAACCSMYAADC